MASVAQNLGTAKSRKPAARRGGKMSVGGKIWLFFMVVLLPVLLLGVAGTGYALYLFRATTHALPTPDAMTDYTPGGLTEIYATDKDPKTGKLVVLGRVFTRYKEFASIDKIPQVLKDATVAVEDERFYQHVGVDVRGIGRAVYRDARDRRMGEGGSTLTQQLVRNMIPSVGSKKTVSRKLQEMMLALQLERNYSKEEILELYLNEVCYGANTYGVKAAAKMYFGKPVDKLTVGEAALLAGLPQRPADYELFDHLDTAMERRKTVLAKMVEQKYITPQQEAQAEAEKIKIIPRVDYRQTDFKAPFFTNYVLRQLIATYGKGRGVPKRLKGLHDAQLADAGEAERALINGVLAGKGDRVTEGAIVCLEPHQGYIRAMVGGIDYSKNQFNNVTQGRRQPGSAFKPFVYTAAFETHKYNPDSTINDAPVKFGKYSPHNFDNRFHGWVSIRQAVAHSYNVPPVRIANDIGINRVIETAQKMGITSPLKNPKSATGDLSLALGTYDVSPLEIASAYDVFPNHGSHALPMAIIRVVDSEGKVLENHQAQVVQAVIPESVTRDVSDILRGVVEYGTAASAKGIHEIEDAHGKTGTTSDSKDAWFVGYTPELVTAVWVCGVKRNAKTGKVQYLPMEGVTGGHICAPIWSRFMLAAVPIQRQSGEPIQPSPEKNVPGNLSASGLSKNGDEEDRPRRRRRRSAENADENAAAKNNESPSPAPSAADTPGDKGEKPSGGDPPPAPGGEENKPEPEHAPTSGGNNGGEKKGGEAAPETPPAAPPPTDAPMAG